MEKRVEKLIKTEYNEKLKKIEDGANEFEHPNSQLVHKIKETKSLIAAHT